MSTHEAQCFLTSFLHRVASTYSDHFTGLLAIGLRMSKQRRKLQQSGCGIEAFGLNSESPRHKAISSESGRGQRGDGTFWMLESWRLGHSLCSKDLFLLMKYSVQAPGRSWMPAHISY